MLSVNKGDDPSKGMKLEVVDVVSGRCCEMAKSEPKMHV